MPSKALIRLHCYLLALGSCLAVFEPPVSTTVAQHSRAAFRCQATGFDYLDWFVDGRLAIYQHIFTSVTTWRNGVIYSVLSAVATPANNGTSVKCEVSTDQDVVRLSQPAILTVQGLLASPGDLKVRRQERDRIVLGWTLPFTQDSIPITSINLYYRESSSDYMKLIQLPGNSTTYDFTQPVNGSLPDLCVTYIFQVAAANEVGEGGLSDFIGGNFQIAPEPIQSHKVGVTIGFRERNKTAVAFIFPEESCSGKAAQSYSVFMTCKSANFSELKPKVRKLEQYIVVEFEAMSDVLPTNNVYECVLVATNAMGSAASNRTITASTFDVQSAEVMLQPPGQLCLSCQFANGSAAKGCLAEVAEFNFALSALRPTDSLNAFKCTDFSASGGSFQVLVYDIEADGTRSNTPAVTTMIFVTETEGQPEKQEQVNYFVIFGGGVTFCLILVVATVVAICLITRWRRSKVSVDPTNDPERVYEEIPDCSDKKDAARIHLTKNSAYESTKPMRP